MTARQSVITYHLQIPGGEDWSLNLDAEKQVLDVLDEVLSLNGRSAGFSPDTPLLGAIPELDSMAVVSVLTTLEERFDFIVDDDEIDATVFETVGSLVSFVDAKL